MTRHPAPPPGYRRIPYPAAYIRTQRARVRVHYTASAARASCGRDLSALWSKSTAATADVTCTHCRRSWPWRAAAAAGGRP